MKKFLVGFALFSTITIAHAAVNRMPLVNDYPFEKEIQIPSLSAPEMVSVPLDAEVLNTVNARFGNISIVDKENTAIEYEVFFEDFHRVKNPQVIEVSSARMENDKQLLVDDNVLTTFAFDERIDGREASWALIDLGKEVPLTRLETFTADTSPIRYIAIEGGQTKDSLTTLVAKRPMQQRIELNTDLIRFIKVSFWGAQVKVDDIRITAGKKGSLYFSAIPSMKYRVLYGGTETDRILYTNRTSTEQAGLTIAYLGRQKFNNVFPVDLDDDGVDIEEDNCPFVSNSSQRDSDGDRVGNECDNAPEVMNSRQEDIDGDGVGDIIDNCKLVPNIDQADSDGDNWGDACDNAHAEEAGAFLSIALKITGIIGLLALIIAGLWFAKRVRKAKR